MSLIFSVVVLFLFVFLCVVGCSSVVGLGMSGLLVVVGSRSALVLSMDVIS